MTAIPIRSCRRCRPDLWEVVGPASGVYTCVNCRKLYHSILEKIDKTTLKIKNSKEEKE